MTIKNFAALCGCTMQTLRYYDSIDLLKPAMVDKQSKYRFYNEEQALTFVKIKSLQGAGFTTREIRELLNQSDDVLYNAFNQKIAELEDRLKEIRSAQRSYRHEVKEMDERINRFKHEILKSMQAFDASKEFGIDANEYSRIKESIGSFFDNIDADKINLDIDEKQRSENNKLADNAPDNMPQNEDYDLVYEKHGWEHIREFLSEVLSNTGSAGSFMFCIYHNHTDMNKALAVNNILLNLIMANKQGACPLDISAASRDSKDGQNHFYLYKRKKQA